mmetsp:Transcript_10528/g.26402  ORF Transcript_10528/g.26402 Transcript_10528/m.26402 type:complete len:201 (-) Transcript_10528:123-725(-)
MTRVEHQTCSSIHTSTLFEGTVVCGVALALQYSPNNSVNHMRNYNLITNLESSDGVGLRNRSNLSKPELPPQCHPLLSRDPFRRTTKLPLPPAEKLAPLLEPCRVILLQKILHQPRKPPVLLLQPAPLTAPLRLLPRAHEFRRHRRRHHLNRARKVEEWCGGGARGAPDARGRAEERAEADTSGAEFEEGQRGELGRDVG